MVKYYEAKLVKYCYSKSSHCLPLSLKFKHQIVIYLQIYYHCLIFETDGHSHKTDIHFRLKPSIINAYHRMYMCMYAHN